VNPRSNGALRARGGFRPGPTSPSPFGLPTAPRLPKARHFVTQIVGGHPPFTPHPDSNRSAWIAGCRAPDVRRQEHRSRVPACLKLSPGDQKPVVGLTAGRDPQPFRAPWAPSYSKISKDWNPSAGASGALARRGALCIWGGLRSDSSTKKENLNLRQGKFFRAQISKSVSRFNSETISTFCNQR
jgi:hypothetical protein